MSVPNLKHREQITLPISTTSKVSDDVLFESADGSQFFYLPRYRIAEFVVSGKKRLRIQVNNDEENRRLTIYLEKYPAPELESRYHFANELPHQVVLVLKFEGSHGLIFQEVTSLGKHTKGVLKIENSYKMNELINVMTSASYNTAIEIQRTMNVATLYDIRESSKEFLDIITCYEEEIKTGDIFTGNIPATLPETIENDCLKRREAEYHWRMDAFRDFEEMNSRIIDNTYNPSLPAPTNNSTCVPPPPAPPSPCELESTYTTCVPPEEPPCVPVYPSSPHPTYSTLSFFDYMDSLRETKYRKITDEEIQKWKQNITEYNQRVEFLKSAPLFIENEFSLKERDVHFVFNPFIYDYIFNDVKNTEDNFIQYQVVWNGLSYSYYQEEDRPTVFRYLPHAFKLTCLPEDPDIPCLSIKFVWEDNNPQHTGVQLTYRAVPFIDTARRAAEAEQLRQQTHQEPIFEPLTSPSRLRIAIPSDWSTDNQPHVKEPIDLRQGFEDTVALTWEGFRQVYNSLFSHTSLLKGEIIVQVNPQQQELIPFIARVDDFVGTSSFTPEPNALLQKLLGSQVTPKIERMIQITTYPFMFNAPPDRPNDSVLAILVDFFERGDKISLTSDKLSVKVTLRMSVSDYVLSKFDEGDYRYQVTLIYSNGQEVKRSEKVSSDDNLYITWHD